MDRTIQPEIQALKNFHILSPVRTTLPNGVPLTVVNAGEQEVVRMDILFAGGRWQQSQKLQALFTNRMLREGTQKYTAATIAEKLDYYGSWLELSSSSEYAYITVYSLNKYLAKTLEVVESMIKEPVFPEKELHTILDTNIQQYLVNTSKVDFLAHRGLLQALDDFTAEAQLDKSERQNVRQQVYSYCSEQLQAGEEIELESLSKELAGVSEVSFQEFTADKGYELEESFPADRSTLRQLTKFAGSGGGLTINFDAMLLGERIFWDPATDTLTIKGTPPNLRDQLQRRTSGGK